MDRDWSGVENALAEYDSTSPERLRNWRNVSTDSEADLAQNEDELALEKVRRAFFEVTQDINNWPACKVVTLDYIRRMTNPKYRRA